MNLDYDHHGKLEAEFAYYAELMAYADLIRELDAVTTKQMVTMEDLTGIGKIAEQLPELTKEVRSLVERLFGPAVDEAGQLAAEYLKRLRMRNTAKALEKTDKILQQKSIEAKSVGTRILMPILDEMGLEEDEYLQDRWAHLLASAASGKGIHPSYISILKDLDVVDAKALETLRAIESTNLGLTNSNPSETDLLAYMASQFNVKDLMEKLYKGKSYSTEEVIEVIEKRGLISQSVDNLKRLQLIDTKGERGLENTLDGERLVNISWGYKVSLSQLGERFLNAVSPK